ncbi:WecB/TagA/CpsF family glycosyltransferase [Ornithinibacillus scapharcae]|uniref:WecB/TagA/CpsF family glycosyltransferase n=1 Tax=Ornithinibacillus scapharcae TaxID=1147159 RepID=UPI000225BB54|nr:WecB/TagA/CpsF family glycosyltransferase [Ornithinibacillus scapharcae]
MDKVTIMGVPFLNIDQNGFVELLDNRIQQKQKTFVVTANPEIVMKANEDEKFNSIIQEATYTVADGIGVVKAANILKTPLPGRVTGFDTMVALLHKANENNYKVYLLGAQQEVLTKLIAIIHRDYPNIDLVGSHNGFFDLNDNTIADEVAELKPDMTFVALGAPRQEIWIHQNWDKFEHGLFMGVGGSFDGIAGVVKRAPKIWQKLNLEWLYRLLQQPSRWKRMLVLPKFMFKIMRMKRSA